MGSIIKQGIYRITNSINGKCYVGQSIDIENRWLDHKTTPFNLKDKAYAYPIYRAIRKYGLNNFIFEILEIVKERSLLTERELFHYKALTPEYNQILPGESPGRAKLSKPVYQINPITLEIVGEYSSVSEAARQTNTHQQLISRVLVGKRKTTGGFIFKYK